MQRPAPWSHILVLEDDSAANSRRILAAVGGSVNKNVTLRLHEIRDGSPRTLCEHTYRVGTLRKRALGGRASAALDLLDQSNAAKSWTVVVAGAVYGSNQVFLKGLRERGLAFVTEVGSSVLRDQGVEITERLQQAKWIPVQLSSPLSNSSVRFTAAKLSSTLQPLGVPGLLFAMQSGSINHDTILAVSSERKLGLKNLLRTVGWVRWIRPALRRRSRQSLVTAVNVPSEKTIAAKQARILVRANIAQADRQDERTHARERFSPSLRGVLGAKTRPLRMIELFAGAGGMGLGFLLAGRADHTYDLRFSGEVNPIYIATLKRNHAAIRKHRRDGVGVPDATVPTDLRSAGARGHIANLIRGQGGIDVLIGGPPCQGFSNANRNSWSSRNPNNRLVDVFMTYVELLRPPVFVMENVQGILWTPRPTVPGWMRQSPLRKLVTRAETG